MVAEGRSCQPPQGTGAYIYVAHETNLWGADHFDMLFGHASEVAAADYDAIIAELNRIMPLAAYVEAEGKTRSP